ncbi:MAG: hypothetical protein MJY59_01145 [Bacteroidaceae bacterium]|nr:hypothetical protein [Bacteroidaceae bacterium]
MKKYFTLIAALGLSVMAYAQEPTMPDFSGVEPGTDVSSLINWGDYDGKWSAGSYLKDGAVTQTPYESPWWKGDQPNECAVDGDLDTYPMLGFYNDGAAGDHLINMYQVFQLPAGLYTFTFNAVYREGTPIDTWASYVAKNPKKNAHFYVTTLETNDPEGAVIRDFDKVVQSLPYSIVTECLYESADQGASWKTDGSYAFIDENGDTTKVVFYPNCDEGAALHFLAGNYAHELKFILLKPGYVRLGIRKTANISQDWLGWSNMKIIYEGPADESAELAMAQSDYQDARAKVEELESRVDAGGFTALVSIMEDYLLELEPDENNLEELVAATKDLDEKYEVFSKAFEAANNLGDLVASSNDMYLSTDFAGKEAFGLAIEAAAAIAYAESIESADDYTKAFASLSAARATYLNSQEVGSMGEKDFTSLIKHPWFVNPENTPILIDNRRGDGTRVWVITENGEPSEAWNEQKVASGCTAVNNVINPGAGRQNIVSKVTLSADVEATNQWYKVTAYSDGWSPGLSLNYHGGLIGPSDGWNSIAKGTIEVQQHIVGLPEGYYSLKGLMRGNQGGQTWNGEAHNIFAKNSAGETVKSPVGNKDSYYSPQYGWNEWNGNVWQEHKTSIISVPDGELVIGAQSSMVMISTGFRLFFYGTEPPFDAMIEEDIANVQEQLETKALWLGDKAFVQSKLDAIAGLRPLSSTAAYEQAMAYAKEATDYIRTADGVISKFSAIDDYTSLQLNYEETADQYLILNPALNYVTALEAGENSTYKDAEEAGKVYKAYASYLKMYDAAAALQSDVYAPILAKQSADLKANYSNEETLKAYEEELSVIYSQEVIKALGGDKATEQNPINVTVLLNNPNFDGTGGWSGTTPSQNEYGAGRHVAEIWNQATFNMYQTVKGLPAGAYKLTVNALYRDGNGSSDLQKCYDTWMACGQDKSKWENQNALLYMRTSYAQSSEAVTSVCDTEETALSFPGGFKITDAGYTVGNNGTFLLFEELTDEDKATVVGEDGTIFYDADKTYKPEGGNFQYPFDGRVYDADSTALYFPESMTGAILRFNKGEYALETSLVVANDGDNMDLGIQKLKGFNGDWVIFSNFQLFYLGKATPTSISGIASVEDNATKVYNLAGQAVGNGFKGIVIKNGVKVLNK